MMRLVCLSLLVSLCAACGGNSDGGLFDPSLASGGNVGGGNDGGANTSGGTGSNSGGMNSSGGTNNSGGSTGNGGSTGSGGAANGGVSNGGTAHGGAGGSNTAGGGGTRSCEQLIDDAYDALSKARACDPQTDVPHCTGFVNDPCDCPVPIENPESAEARAYAAALQQMENRGCSIVCLSIVCIELEGGVCHENGSC